MYPVINQALEALRASLAEASGFDPTRSKRTFRINIPHPMGPFYALELRAAVAATAPGVALTFDTVSMPVDLEENLRDGIVDLAIDWLPVELDPFVNRKLFDDRLVLIARSGHPSAAEGMTIEDLRKVEFVTPHRRREVEHLPQALRELYGLHLHVVVRVSELLEIPAVVASTDLLGLMPASLGSLMEKRMGLRVLVIPLELPVVPVYMIWHQTRRNDSGHRWLREIVAKEVGRLTST
jgi:DNA-binding transcriptional LysR family regulator